MVRLLALIGILGISFSAIFVRLAETSPSTAAIFRGAYAIPLLVLIWLTVRQSDRRPARSRWLAFVSGLLLAVDLTLWHRSIGFVGAGLSTLVANVQVVFVGFVAWIYHRERPTTSALLVVPVVFGGVALISGLGRADSYGADPVRGVVLALLAACAYTGFLLVFRAANRDLTHPAGPLLDSTLGLTLGAFLLGATDPGVNLSPAWPSHYWLIAMAVVSQVVGWLLIAVALPRLAALETSVLLLLQPLLTVLWGGLIFHETLGRLQWVGALLVMGGIATLSFRGSVVPTIQKGQRVE